MSKLSFFFLAFIYLLDLYATLANKGSGKLRVRGGNNLSNGKVRRKKNS